MINRIGKVIQIRKNYMTNNRVEVTIELMGDGYIRLEMPPTIRLQVEDEVTVDLEITKVKNANNGISQ